MPSSTLMDRAREFLSRTSTRQAAVAIIPLALAAGRAAAEQIKLVNFNPNPSGGIFGAVGNDYRTASQTAGNFWANHSDQDEQPITISLADLVNLGDYFTFTPSGNGNGQYTADLSFSWGSDVTNAISSADTLTLHYSVAVSPAADSGTTASSLQLSLTPSDEVQEALNYNTGLFPTHTESLAAGGSSGQIGLQFLDDPNTNLNLLAAWEAKLSIHWVLPPDLPDYSDSPDLSGYKITVSVPGGALDSSAPNYVELSASAAAPAPSTAGGFIALLAILAGFTPRRLRVRTTS